MIIPMQWDDEKDKTLNSTNRLLYTVLKPYIQLTMPVHQIVELTGTNVRYCFSVIDIMPLVSGTMSPSISSLGGKPRIRA